MTGAASSPQTNQSSPSRSRPQQLFVKFHKFGDLPVEIRLMIWEFTIEPRQIQLDLIGTGDMVKLREDYPTDLMPPLVPLVTHFGARPRRFTPLPTALHINTESRYLFLPQYRQFFQQSLWDQPFQRYFTNIYIPLDFIRETWNEPEETALMPQPPPNSGIRFNPRIDTIELCGNRNAILTLGLCIAEKEFVQIRNLKMKYSLWANIMLTRDTPQFPEVLSKLKGLEHLTLIGDWEKRLTQATKNVEDDFKELEEKIDSWRSPSFDMECHFPKARCCSVCEQETGTRGTRCNFLEDFLM